MKRAAILLVVLSLTTALVPVTELAEARSARSPGELGYLPLDVGEENERHCVFEELRCDPPAPTAWLESDQARAYGKVEAYTENVSVEGLITSLKRLRQTVNESSTFDDAPGAPNGELMRRSLTDELTAAIWVLEREDAEPIDLEGRSFRVVEGSGPVLSNTIIFEGRDSQIVLREAVPDPDDPLSEGDLVHYATVEQATEVRVVCWIVFSMFNEIKRAIAEGLYEKAVAADRGWTNYLENGYSQYPWEVIVNNTVTKKLFGKYSWDNPPREQLVFLHPEFCTLVDASGNGGRRTAEALIVHGLGYVRYFGEERSWFVGLSGSACFSDVEPDVGYGATLHVDTAGLGLGLPHLSVGAMWFNSDEAWDDPVVSVTADFWGLLGSSDIRPDFPDAER
jgi:hypothetical protein